MSEDSVLFAEVSSFRGITLVIVEKFAMENRPKTGVGDVDLLCKKQKHAPFMENACNTGNYIWIAGHGRCIYYWICWVMLYDVPLKLHANKLCDFLERLSVTEHKACISICWAKRICFISLSQYIIPPWRVPHIKILFQLLGSNPYLSLTMMICQIFYHGDTNIKHWHYIQNPELTWTKSLFLA